MNRTVSVLSILGLAACTHALVIDNFSVGQADIQLTTTGQTATRTVVGAFAGFDRRTTFAEMQASLLNQPLDVKIAGNSLGLVNSGSGSDGFVQLSYFTAGVRTIDLSEFDRFRIHFAENTRDLNLKFGVVTSGGAGVAIGQNLLIAAGTTGVVEIDRGLVAFDTGADWSKVDELVFQFDPMSGGDFAIASVEAVPEPATIALVAIGIAGIARRRRARN
jgi:hypothetical protein